MKSTENDPSIFHLLHQDHQRILARFSRIERTSKQAVKTKIELFRNLRDELNHHTSAEERTIYPRLQQIGQTAIDGYESELEHDLMKSLLSKLNGLDAGDERWAAALTVLKNIVVHHLEIEESRIFRQMRNVFDRDELTRLPEEFRAAKGTLREPLKRTGA